MSTHAIPAEPLDPLAADARFGAAYQLLAAIYAQDAPRIRREIDSGADPDGHIDGHRPILAAVRRSSPEVVAIVAQALARLPHHADLLGEALLLAVQLGKPASARELALVGADPLWLGGTRKIPAIASAISLDDSSCLRALIESCPPTYFFGQALTRFARAMPHSAGSPVAAEAGLALIERGLIACQTPAAQIISPRSRL